MRAPPMYEAFGLQGAYDRPAAIIHELPTPEARGAALEVATPAIAEVLGIAAMRRIPFGAPVYEAFGMLRRVAKKHPQASLLLTLGCDLSLSYAGYQTELQSST